MVLLFGSYGVLADAPTHIWIAESTWKFEELERFDSLWYYLCFNFGRFVCEARCFKRYNSIFLGKVAGD